MICGVALDMADMPPPDSGTVLFASADTGVAECHFATVSNGRQYSSIAA